MPREYLFNKFRLLRLNILDLMINGGVATPQQQTLRVALRCSSTYYYPPMVGEVGLEPTSPLYLLGFGIEGWDRTTDLKIISFAFYQLNYSDMYGGE